MSISKNITKGALRGFFWACAVLIGAPLVAMTLFPILLLLCMPVLAFVTFLEGDYIKCLTFSSIFAVSVMVAFVLYEVGKVYFPKYTPRW